MFGVVCVLFFIGVVFGMCIGILIIVLIVLWFMLLGCSSIGLLLYSVSMLDLMFIVYGLLLRIIFMLLFSFVCMCLVVVGEICVKWLVLGVVIGMLVVVISVSVIGWLGMCMFMWLLLLVMMFGMILCCGSIRVSGLG